MKSGFLIGIFTTLSLSLFASYDNPILIESKIKDVTVFLSGAQIQRNASKMVASGTHYVKFVNLSPRINVESIQVAGKGNVTILSVSHQLNDQQEANMPPRVKSLQDSLNAFKFELEFNQNMKSVFEEEKQMILANKRIGWEKSSFAIEDVEDLADFYRDRLADIMLKILELKSKEKKTSAQIARLNRQLKELDNTWTRSSGEIIVEVSASSNGIARFELSYLVDGAGWLPTYDLRANDISSPVKLKYNARVFQSTGISWDQVELTLATSNPNLSGSKPNIAPWTLYFQLQNADRKIASYNGKMMLNQQSNRKVDSKIFGGNTSGYNLQAPGEYALVSEGQTNVEFEIAVPYNIPSDGRKHLVNINSFELPASYEYYSAPKLETDAFLLAKAVGRDDLNLLSGEANLYFKETYIGKSFIDMANTVDTLNLSLGRDNGVVVTRKKIKDFVEDKIIGPNKKETLGIEITIRNTKKTAINLLLEDQIPVSSNKDIQVSLDQAKGAQHSEQTGILQWNVQLNPSETKKFFFRYTVKYPKDQTINL